MKVGDKVRIRTGRRGRPPVGEILEVLNLETGAKYKVATKNGPEIYGVEELELVPPTD